MRPSFINLCLIFLLSIIVVACSTSQQESPIRRHVALAEVTTKEAAVTTKEDAIRLHPIDPAYANSGELGKYTFIPNGRIGVQISTMSISKKLYKRVIMNADSGHAYDAFIAALAYRVGYFRDFYGSSKGINTDKYLHYLQKSAALGWPEASMILYECNREEGEWSKNSTGIRKHIPLVDEYRNKLSTYCLPTFKPDPYPQQITYPLPPNVQKGKAYLLQALSKGRNFDTNLNYVGPDLVYESSLQYELEQWLLEIEIDVVDSYKEDRGHLAAYQEIFPEAKNHCDAQVAYLIEKSRKHNEPRECGNGSPYGASIFHQYSARSRSCPGAGYNQVRAHLEVCMDLAQSDADLDRFYEKRLEFYHPYEDRELEIFHKGMMAYGKRRDNEKALWVDAMRLKAISINRNSQGKWQEKNRQYISEREQISRKIQAERDARQHELEEDQRVSTERYNRFQAQIRKNEADTAAAW